MLLVRLPRPRYYNYPPTTWMRLLESFETLKRLFWAPKMETLLSPDPLTPMWLIWASKARTLLSPVTSRWRTPTTLSPVHPHRPSHMHQHHHSSKKRNQIVHFYRFNFVFVFFSWSSQCFSSYDHGNVLSWLMVAWRTGVGQQYCRLRCWLLSRQDQIEKWPTLPSWALMSMMGHD